MTPALLEEAKQLIIGGNFHYQPFVFSNQLEVGVAYETIAGKKGSVYWPGAPVDQVPHLKLWLIPDGDRAEFMSSNQKLREINDSYLDQLETHYSVKGKSVADVGCFAGYFPVSLSLRGAASSTGYDIFDRTASFALLNKAVGSSARFINAGYDLESGRIPGSLRHSLVICHDLVCHIPETLRFVRCIADMAEEALFLKCPAWYDASKSFYVTYGKPNRVFPDYKYPWCFDNDITPSLALLMESLEKLGFKKFIEISTAGYFALTVEPPVERQRVTFSILALR